MMKIITELVKDIVSIFYNDAFKYECISFTGRIPRDFFVKKDDVKKDDDAS